MIAIDTNVVVRLLTNDDPTQATRAADLLARERILVPKTVLLETEWVLRYSYEIPQPVVLAAIRKLLGLSQVAAEDATAIARALEILRRRHGFRRCLAPCLHA